MANPLPCKLCPILRLSPRHSHHGDPDSIAPRYPGLTTCAACKNFKGRFKDETARLLPAQEEATTAVPEADAEARATAAEARATAAETRATAAEAKATAAETRATAAEALTEARATDAEAEARATAAETKATAAEAKATAAEIRATTAETERAKALREHKKMFDDLQAHFKRSKEREAARKTSAQVLVDAPAATVDPADSTQVDAAPAAHPKRKYNRDLDSVKSQTPEGMVCRVNPEGLPRYWALDQILDSRWKQGTDQKEYLCKWFGYDENEATWHDADELFKCSIKIHHYETKGMQTGSKRSIGEIASSSSDATTAPTTGSSSIDDPTAQAPQAQAPFKAPRRIN